MNASTTLLHDAMDDTSDHAHAIAARRILSDKHFGAAACELFEAQEKKRGDWKPTSWEASVIEFMDKVEARAMQLAEFELMASPAPTPNGRWVGIATDAIAALQSILALADTCVSLPTGIKIHDLARPVLKRAGVR